LALLFFPWFLAELFNPIELDTVFMAELAAFVTEFMAEFTPFIVLLMAAVTGFVADSALGSSIVGSVGTGTDPPVKNDLIIMKR
jgi:hypothetical protein